MTYLSLNISRSRFLSAVFLSGTCALAVTHPAFAQNGDVRGTYATIGVTQIKADLDLSSLSAAGTTIDLGQQDAKVNMITGT